MNFSDSLRGTDLSSTDLSSTDLSSTVNANIVSPKIANTVSPSTRAPSTLAPCTRAPKIAAHGSDSFPDMQQKNMMVHRNMWRIRAQRYLPTTITILILIGAWEIWVRLGHVPPALLSAPSDVAVAIVQTWPTLGAASAITALEGMIGFLIAIVCGVLLGIGLYISRIIQRSVFPLIYAAQTMPLISIAPLFLIWFGFTMAGKIAIVAIFALFPIAVQTLRGLKAVPQFYSDVALTSGATPAWTLWHVKLRVAARQIFGGIRISAAYVFATAATAEYLGARAGLGIWLQSAYNSFRTPLILAATVVIVALTGALIALVHVCERILLGPSSADASE